MSEPGRQTPDIRTPKTDFPWGFTIVVVLAMVALAVFGSWGFATFGA